VRDGRIINGVGFRLYEGTQLQLDQFADGLGATDEELSTLFTGQSSELMESESEDRVRVVFPPTATVENDVQLQLDRHRVEHQARPTYRVQAFQNVVPFQFCCGRDKLSDDPVQERNEDALKWLKQNVPRKARKKKVRVIGYASTIGECKRNQALSSRRAHMVKRKLRSMGFTDIDVEPCGELGPANDPTVQVDQGPFWQRVDVVLAPEVLSFRFGHQTPSGKSIKIPEGTQVTMSSGSSLMCTESLTKKEAEAIEIVMLIDTSGSMNEEWARQIAPHLGDRVSDLVSRFKTEGYRAWVHVYTLGSDLCRGLESPDSPYLTCTMLSGNSLAPCGGREANESWGTGTSWASRFHPWRPGALRSILPISDELACEGDHTSTLTEDIAAVDEAIDNANRYGVTVFPHFGSIHGGPTGYVQRHMWRLGHETHGVAQPLDFSNSSSINTIYDALLSSVSRTSHSTTVTCVEDQPSEHYSFTFTGKNTPTQRVVATRRDLRLTQEIGDNYVGNCNSPQECPEEREARPRSRQRGKEPQLDCRTAPQE
jgi:outer membrane protein OmpA-like peptidoglycan-associated protein